MWEMRSRPVLITNGTASKEAILRLENAKYWRFWSTRCAKYDYLSHGPNNNNKHAYAGQLNSFKCLRVLLVLHDRGIFWPRQLSSLATDQIIIIINMLMPVN
jgi:hypothetical protein